MAAVWDTIVQAVVTKLKTLNIDGIGQRVYASTPAGGAEEQGIDGYDCLFVGYEGLFEQMLGGDPLADEIGLPVLVSWASNTLHELSARSKQLAGRQVISDALAYQRLAGVPEVQTCIPEPGPAAYAPDPENQFRMRADQVFRFIARKGHG